MSTPRLTTFSYSAFKSRILFSVVATLPLTLLIACSQNNPVVSSQKTTSVKQQNYEKRFDEVFNKLEHLQKTFDQTKTKLESIKNSRLQEHTLQKEEVEEVEENLQENVFVELGMLQAKIQDLEAFLKEVVKMQPILFTLRENILSVLKNRDQQYQLVREEEIAKQGIAIAKEYNWRFGKEFMLWVFGFKWLWGWFTGFVPTTSTYDASHNYNSVVEKNSKILSTLESRTKEAELRVQTGIEEIGTFFDQLIKKSPLPEYALTLLDIKLTLFYTIRNFLHSNLVVEEKLALFRQEMIASQPHTPFAVSSTQDEQLSLLEQFFKQEYLLAKEEQESVLRLFNAFFLPPLAPKEQENIKEIPQEPEVTPSLNSFVHQLLKQLDKLRQSKDIVVDKIAHLKKHHSKSSLSLSLSNTQDSSDKSKTQVALTPQEEKRLKKYNQQLLKEIHLLEKGLKNASIARAHSQEFLNNIQRLKVLQFEALESLSNILKSIHTYSHYFDRVVIKEQAVRERRRNSFYFLRELGLYLLGFKWLWGLGTGFAPTVYSARQESEAYQALKEFNTHQAALQQQIQEQLAKLNGILSSIHSISNGCGVGCDIEEFLATNEIDAFQSGFLSVVQEYLRLTHKHTALREGLLRDLANSDSEHIGQTYQFGRLLREFLPTEGVIRVGGSIFFRLNLQADLKNILFPSQTLPTQRLSIKQLQSFNHSSVALKNARANFNKFLLSPTNLYLPNTTVYLNQTINAPLETHRRIGFLRESIKKLQELYTQELLEAHINDNKL